MPHITPISEEAATGSAAALYRKARGQFGYLPNMHQAFSLRPEYMSAWAALLEAIKARLSPRLYELVTVAAAVELKSSYCSLAHGQILAEQHAEHDGVIAIVTDTAAAGLEPADRAVVQFARAVIKDAASITQQDVDLLRNIGFDDGEICDITAAASVRCFFSKYLDALGFAPDAAYNDLPDDLRNVLTVGRPISD